MSFYDDFNRADSASVGNGWTEKSPTHTSISSNKLYFAAGGRFEDGMCHAPSAADFEDGSVSVDFVVDSAQAVPQVHARYNVAGNTSYIVYCSESQLHLARRNVGSLSVLNSASGNITPGTNYRLTLTLDGTSKTGTLRNIDTQTNIATVNDVSDSAFLGVGATAVSSHLNGNIEYDNFSSTPAGTIISSSQNQQTSIIAAAHTSLTPTITTEPLKNNTGTLLASTPSITANVYDISTGALVVRKTGLTSNAAGVIAFSDAAMNPVTEYIVVLSIGVSDGVARITTS